MRRFLLASVLIVISLTTYIQVSYAKIVQISLVNGSSQTGEVELLDEEKTLCLTDQEGLQFYFKYEEVSPLSLFSLFRARLEDNDEAGYMDLAEFAREHQLYRAAITAVNRVISLDGELRESAEAQLPGLRALDQEGMLAKISALIDEAKFKSVRKSAKALIKAYPESEAARQAQNILNTLEDLEKEAEAAAAKAADQKKLAEKFAKAEALWATARKHKSTGAEHFKDGLNHELNGYHVRAQDSYKKAEDAFRKTHEALDVITAYCEQEPAVKKKYYDNADGEFEVDKEVAGTYKKIISVLLNSASTYLRDELFRDAKNQCNKVLVIDSENREATKLKFEIIRRESAEQR